MQYYIILNKMSRTTTICVFCIIQWSQQAVAILNFSFMSTQNRSVRDFDLLAHGDSWPIICATIPRAGRHSVYIEIETRFPRKKKKKKMFLNRGIYIHTSHNIQCCAGEKKIVEKDRKKKTRPKLKRVVRGRKRCI